MRFIVPILMGLLLLLLVIVFIWETNKSSSFYHFTKTPFTPRVEGNQFQNTNSEPLTPMVEIRLTSFNGAQGVASFEAECTDGIHPPISVANCDSIILSIDLQLGTNPAERSIYFNQQKKQTWIMSAGGLPAWFPLEEFDMKITLKGILYSRILGNVAGFQHDVQDVEAHDSSVVVQIHLSRSYAAKVFSGILLLSALLPALIYAWKYRGRDVEGIIGGAGYLLSLWGIRQIVADANITFPTLFDGLLIASFLVYGAFVYWPIQNQTNQKKAFPPAQKAQKPKRR